MNETIDPNYFIGDSLSLSLPTRVSVSDLRCLKARGGVELDNNAMRANKATLVQAM